MDRADRASFSTAPNRSVSCAAITRRPRLFAAFAGSCPGAPARPRPRRARVQSRPSEPPSSGPARRRRPPPSASRAARAARPARGRALRTCDFFSWRFDSVELALAATLAASPCRPCASHRLWIFPSLRCKGCRCSAASVQRVHCKQRLSERLRCSRGIDVYGCTHVRNHHGSLARELAQHIEQSTDSLARGLG